MHIIDIATTNFNTFIIGIAALGFIIGSFLNVVIHRLPIILQNEQTKDCLEDLYNNNSLQHKTFNLLIPRSHCPKCKTTILWWQNIPLLSYIILKGKCKNCSTSVSWRYPLVEILTAVATVLPVIYFGINAQAFSLVILSWILIPAIFIDLDKQLLPDQLTIPIIWLGLLISTMHIFTTPTDAIIGSISGYLFLWIINKTFKLIRKVDGMGYGDFKLLAAFGAWLGWQMLPIIILVSSLSGSIIGIFLIIIKKHEFSKRLPFGPFLATTGWLAFFYGKTVLNWLSTILCL